MIQKRDLKTKKKRTHTERKLYFVFIIFMFLYVRLHTCMQCTHLIQAFFIYISLAATKFNLIINFTQLKAMKYVTINFTILLLLFALLKRNSHKYNLFKLADI